MNKMHDSLIKRASRFLNESEETGVHGADQSLVKRASRFLFEAPEDEIGADPTADPTTDPAATVDPAMDNSDEETGEDTSKIEIYFSNLDAETQKAVMTSLKKAVNASDDDKFAEKKIVDQLSKTPLFVVMGDELQRQLQIRI